MLCYKHQNTIYEIKNDIDTWHNKTKIISAHNMTNQNQHQHIT